MLLLNSSMHYEMVYLSQLKTYHLRSEGLHVTVYAPIAVLH